MTSKGPRPDRRSFLRYGAAGVAGLGLIDRALAIAPAGRSGSLRDIRHIVVHMQENRSFDHYFGLLSGVRGFGDPRPLRRPDGRTVWAQASPAHADGFVLPYHGDSRTTHSLTVGGGEQPHRDNGLHWRPDPAIGTMRL